jgi:RNA polymerase sigma-70 factor, ECF subfamily
VPPLSTIMAFILESSRTMDDEGIKEEVRRALAGDEAALYRLVQRLTPVIQRRVARVLFRWRTGPAAGPNVRQEVEDFTQDVFLVLFANDGKVLRDWRPKRGLSFDNFVGLVAERRTVSKLRRKRYILIEVPTPDEHFDQPAPGPRPDENAAWRERHELLLQRLKEELSPLGWYLFDLLFLQELPIKEVKRLTGMSAAAVYAWRSRLRRLVRRLLDELLDE